MIIVSKAQITGFISFFFFLIFIITVELLENTI